METIHLKTIDPISQELLRSAAQHGIELPWERHEKLQPQDGFLRLGLSCPFGCMQGPCRIDPFGRGSQKGTCGLGRDEMVAGTLLRLCLQGTLDALASRCVPHGIPEVRFSTSLNKMIAFILAGNGKADLSVDDIFKSSVMLGRSSSTCQELIEQSFRLSLLTLGYAEQDGGETPSGFKKCSTGYGTLTEHPVRIGFSGRHSAELVQALEQASTGDSGPPAGLVSLGEWIAFKNGFMPIACTSGESELLVSSGAIHTLVAGSETDPGLIDLCRKLSVPVVAADVCEASSVVRHAREVFSTRSQLSLFADAPPAGEGQFLMSGGNAENFVGTVLKGKIALVGGADNPQMSLGQLPVDLATALRDKGFQVAGWGDASVWMIKNGLMSSEQKTPVLALENRQGPLLVVKALAEAGRLDRLQGVCFTGLKKTREFAMALGLAYLGCRVSMAAPIPVQGSQVVKDTMAEMVKANGGQLNHCDHLAQGKEVLEWFTNR